MEAVVLGSKKVYTTAVVLSPPSSTWGPIQALRKQYDKAFERWMPHINLIFPFVPPEEFTRASQVLSTALMNVTPFQITWDRFQSFDHGNKSVIWLHPSATETVRNIEYSIVRAIPLCDDQTTKSENGFTPHLTVGQWSSKVYLDTLTRLAALPFFFFFFFF
eukprot:TRINITY_DN1153_c0_g1_i17.p1 TRINITY_DN1153_c0_g1~~TRINITY_DN1153_c0_g1_i17.p1  ORF type:complete len:162 (-),score=17.07 TRINITY_DN1153_c0_g1_i17:282-767(-)